jgi:hypothetical protein
MYHVLGASEEFKERRTSKKLNVINAYLLDWLNLSLTFNIVA